MAYGLSTGRNTLRVMRSGRFGDPIPLHARVIAVAQREAEDLVESLVEEEWNAAVPNEIGGAELCSHVSAGRKVFYRLGKRRGVFEDWEGPYS